MKYLFIFSTIILISCNESTHKEFNNYEEIQKLGYFQNGWIPEIIPIDAYQIKEVHNLDLGFAFGIFKYNSVPAFSTIFDTLSHYSFDSVNAYIKEINRPSQPDWFIDIDDNQEKRLDIRKWNEFKFIIDKDSKTVYYVR